MSYSLWPHWLQHSRLPCPLPTHGAYSKLMSMALVMPSNHLILCCPLLLPPSIFPSIRVFSNESTLRMRWPKYWSFSFSISSFNEHPGLISFRMDWLDLLAVQGTPKKDSLQHHSSKTLTLRCSTFFIVQLSHPYMTIGKTIALTRWTFVGKLMSLLFNMLSSLVIAFLPRNKHLLISWLQLLCPMSESLSRKTEGLQDNPTGKKGKFITDSSQGPLPHPTQWCRSESPEPKLLHKFIGWAHTFGLSRLVTSLQSKFIGQNFHAGGTSLGVSTPFLIS